MELLSRTYKIAATSGGLGDIVYAIPIMRALGVKEIYIKENWYHYPYLSLYSAMRNLMINEGFEPLPTSGEYPPMQYEPGLDFDFDMDRFREMPGRGRVHIQKAMYKRFKIPFPGFSPWLHIPKPHTTEVYSIIHLTERWRDNSQVNWENVFNSITNKAYFVGFQYEWLDFITKYGQLEFKQTEDILELAKLVAGAKNVYCNQSVVLTLAQGIGKEYFLEQKPGKTNTIMQTKNEHIL